MQLTVLKTQAHRIFTRNISWRYRLTGVLSEDPTIQEIYLNYMTIKRRKEEEKIDQDNQDDSGFLGKLISA